ncbi:DnaB-like helicase N-terminal domain-containing protein [Streptomyces sp. NPDC014846]|uniref:DnaB-like helicase N-terminal domain-containing protein n=1 Tax=Streptomyces sp. NPDC014846 TaxID=3364922 RepID=UPI0036F7649A
MNNEQFKAPQHELNIISSLLRDNSTQNQLVDWNRAEPQYWLRPEHFQTPWLGDAYAALLSGGIGDIKQRLQAYPGADPAQATADAVTTRMMTLYRQRAAAGDAKAQWAVDQAYYTRSEFWAGLHGAIRQMAQPTWPANPHDARHEAYVTVRAAQHPSTTENVPFELSRPRGYDNDARTRELAVIGAVLNDPARVQQFEYTPQSPDASPYWLQPQDFGDPVTAEIWDALVTGPDPAIALPAATDRKLTPQQRAAAMIEHITARLIYNDYHRSTGDPGAQARLDGNVNQQIGTYLAHASAPNFSPNPDNAARYAVTFILEPSIPAAVEDLAGRVRDYGLSDASLGQVGLELSTTEYSLDQLAERLDAAPRTLAGYAAPDQTAKPAPEQSEGQPAYTSVPIERQVLISLMQNPSQLHQGGPTRSLAEQDFTQPEHRYLFKAFQSLPPDAAQDPWLVNNQAQQLARFDGAPRLDFRELDNIALEARTRPVGPADRGAGHLITMTVRRTARDASTAIQAAARETLDPRVLIDQSRQQFQQATREALRYHEQSVPEPTPYGTQQAPVA